MLKDSETYLDYLCNWELVVWCLALGIYIMRFMTLGLKINKKYRNLSVLITEQVSLSLLFLVGHLVAINCSTLISYRAGQSLLWWPQTSPILPPTEQVSLGGHKPLQSYLLQSRSVSPLVATNLSTLISYRAGQSLHWWPQTSPLLSLTEQVSLSIGGHKPLHSYLLQSRSVSPYCFGELSGGHRPLRSPWV